MAADFLFEANYAYAPNQSFNPSQSPRSTSPLGQLAYRGSYDAQSALTKITFSMTAGSMSLSGKGGSISSALNNSSLKSVADKAAAHSYNKHVLGIGNQNGREFGSLIQNQQQLSEYTYGVISNPTLTKQPNNGRVAYWDSRLGSVVIYNSKSPPQSTVFRPGDGVSYYNKLK